MRPAFVIRESPWSTAKPAPWCSAPTTIVRSFSSSKSVAVPADAGLPVEHRAAILELHGQRAEGEERARDHEARARDRDVERAVQRVPSATSHVAGTPRRR